MLNSKLNAATVVTEKPVVDATADLQYRTRLVEQLKPPQLDKLFDDLMKPRRAVG